MKDPVNPTLGVTIRNLQIKMMDLHSQAPPHLLINRVLNDIVSKTLGKVDLKTAPTLEGQMNGMCQIYDNTIVFNVSVNSKLNLPSPPGNPVAKFLNLSNPGHPGKFFRHISVPWASLILFILINFTLLHLSRSRS